MTPTPPIVPQFQADWSRHYGALLPIGWHIRQDEARPWVRFHALPLSKRYAEDEAERATVLFRANSLGDEILGPGTSCWIVEARSNESDGPGELWMKSAEDDDDPDSLVWCFYVRSEDWQPGRYNEKLLAIADDQPDRAIWMSRDTGSVLAPYDGGFDLFLPTWEEVSTVKTDWRDWLSDHPAGF